MSGYFMFISWLHKQDVPLTVHNMSYLILATSIATILVFVKLLLHSKRKPKSTSTDVIDCKKIWSYTDIKQMLQNARIALPVMIVDKDLFESNIKTILDICRRNGKKLRIATKSVRCPYLIKRISDLGTGVISGFMCYSVEEAGFLYECGHDDFFIPYPTALNNDIEKAVSLINKGAKLCLTVDSVAHVLVLDNIIETLAAKSDNTVKLRVCIDLDMSYSFGPIQLGAHRSSIKNVEMFATVAQAITESKHLKLVGCMGYEASVAGLPDNNPHSPIPNILIRFFKGIFYKSGSQFRGDVLKWCFKNGVELEFFNAGGSGNIKQVSQDCAVTEVTVGSAFMQAQLFDYYVDNRCNAACCFVLQCTRVCQDYIVCQSGGFIASGPTSQDKTPVPFNNPYNLKPYTDEGFGEVQTPLQIVGKRGNQEIVLGDPILFRPAKSGEIAEHFNTYLIKKGDKIKQTVPTYRGLGKIFY